MHVLFSLHVHLHVLFPPVALSLCRSFDASDVSAAISETFCKSSKFSKNPVLNVGLLLAISDS